MSVTYDAIKKLVENNKVTSPLIVQVQSVVPIDDKRRRLASQLKSSLEVEAKISDCYYSISTIIICDTIEEANTIKQYSLIEVIDGSMLDGNDSSDDLLFAIKKFKIDSNQVNNQLCPNIKELQQIDQLPSSQIDLSKKTITPFVKLTQYNPEFVVKGVVVSKSKKEEIASKKDHLFNFIIQDVNGNKLKCTCFNDACDKYYNIVNENGTYYISMGYLQPQKDNTFKTDKMIDLDCIITSYSTIQHSKDFIRRKSEPKLIGDLDSCPVDSLYSICVVVTSIGETITKKNNLKMRVIEVVDQSNWTIEIIFWGDSTQIPNEFKVGDIVQFDNLRLNEYGHMNMTFNGSSNYTKTSGSDETRLLSQKLVDNDELPNTQRCCDFIAPSILTMSLKEFEENARNANVKPFKANLTGFITAFKTDTISYIGCNNCKKKVNYNETFCSNCNKKCNPQIFYVLKVEIQDSTNKIWGTMFNEVATKFMGISAKELIDLKKQNFDGYQNSFRGKTFIKVKLGLKGKLDDEMGLHVNIFHCQILDEDETN
ncbi:Replication factor A protein 1 [Entamoeba marina]